MNFLPNSETHLKPECAVHTLCKWRMVVNNIYLRVELDIFSTKSVDRERDYSQAQIIKSGKDRTCQHSDPASPLLV